MERGMVGAFIEVWDAFIGEVQRIGTDPAA